MGFLDKLTGTKRPADGVAPRPAQEVRDALLAQGGGDAPWAVCRAAPDEKAEFVAEWRVREPAWRGFFLDRHLDRTVRIRMRLVPEEREVRALQEQWEVSWVDGTPRFARSREYGRGQGRTVSKQWTFGRDENGGRRLEETFSFDSAELTGPLRDAVLAAGWTWRAVTFGKL
ncbi:hypothetical protein AB0J38_20680 [Streptomyces sp. NPDC050095]|uniref:hypothetical protein n=1 Tax=unclassified Streptomyces TaxID=2593676 RepID=UPI0034123886